MGKMVQTPIMITQELLDAVDRATEPRQRAEWIRQAIRERLARAGVGVCDDEQEAEHASCRRSG